MSDTPLRTLKCLEKAPHATHVWTFKYDKPITPYSCPGIEEKDGSHE